MTKKQTRVCPECGLITSTQGFPGHLRIKHGIKALSRVNLQERDIARMEVETMRLGVCIGELARMVSYLAKCMGRDIPEQLEVGFRQCPPLRFYEERLDEQLRDGHKVFLQPPETGKVAKNPVCLATNPQRCKGS